jgi:hypothetical protein
MLVKYKSGVTEDFEFQPGDPVAVVWEVGKIYKGELAEIDEDRDGFWTMLNDDKSKDKFFAFAELLAVTDPDQAWFWTEEWQKGEREADADIKAGRTAGPFKTVEDALKWLDED